MAAVIAAAIVLIGDMLKPLHARAAARTIRPIIPSRSARPSRSAISGSTAIGAGG